MVDDERVLTSFVLDEETLVDTWSIEGLKDGTSNVPPAGIGDQHVAVTDQRLMWYDGELNEIDREDVDSVDSRDFSHTSAPRIVGLGWVAFGVGVLGSIALFLFTAFDTLSVLVPATTGLATLLTTIIVARMRGETGTEVDLHRLVVDTGEDAVSIWGESEPVDAIQTALDDEVSVSASTESRKHDADGDGDAADEGTIDEDSVDGDAADEGTIDEDSVDEATVDDEQGSGGDGDSATST